MRVQRGFTLIELMIVVAIIAILAAIAIPQYQDFVSRTRASGAMTELGGYRHAVSECISLLSTATGCSAGSNGIPPVLTAFSRNVTAMASVTDRRQRRHQPDHHRHAQRRQPGIDHLDQQRDDLPSHTRAAVGPGRLSVTPAPGMRIRVRIATRVSSCSFAGYSARALLQ
jgi:prepilin-type N-terminal cleavage/methylation domain-containing protein